MTPKEAIDHLVCGRINCLNNADEDEKLRNLCIHALEKQIPKRPENRCSIQIFGPSKTFIGNCAVCGYPVNSNSNYCCNCGQAIDWTEDNKNGSYGEAVGETIELITNNKQLTEGNE